MKDEPYNVGLSEANISKKGLCEEIKKQIYTEWLDARSEELSAVEVNFVGDKSLSFECVLDVLASILIENAERDGTIASLDSRPAAQAA